MRIESIDARALEIPFRVAFMHASAERNAMQSLWVEVRTARGVLGIGEGCPREYVSGESLAGARAFSERHRGDWAAALSDMASLAGWVAVHRAEIDANPAAWSAVELAFLDALGRHSGATLEELLGLAPLSGRYRYSAVIGDAPEAAFRAQLAAYRKAGFADFKIKLSGDRGRDLAKVGAMVDAGVAPRAVRADANNLWRRADAAISHLRSLQFPFFAIEEPLAPGDYDGMRVLADALGARIILDESVLRAEQLAALRADGALWIVNLRISKMGGMLRSIEVVRRARELGMGLVIGAHVGETSVLTRAALGIADLAGDALLAQEGAFSTHLLEHDPVAPSLMFGAGGVLDLASCRLQRSGLGLRKVAPGTT